VIILQNGIPHILKKYHSYRSWTRRKSTILFGHYLNNRSTWDIGVLGYIGIV